MEEYFERFLGLFGQRSRRGVYAAFFLILGISCVPVYFKIWGGQESNEVLNLYIEFWAPFIGFTLSVVLMKAASKFLSRFEDEQKVCYDDHVLKKQYGDTYWETFSFHTSDDFCPVPQKLDSFDDLVKRSECSYPNIFYHRAKYLVNLLFHKIADLRHHPNATNEGRLHIDPLFDAKDVRDKRLTVHDSPDLKDQFRPDLFIKINSLDIISAHKQSQIKHGLTVRLRDLKKSDKEIVLETHRSTYIANLLTNRAIDYKIHGQLSLRELFENRPELSPLSATWMSNHIGINVLVFLEGGRYLLLPKRDKKGSIAKNMLTASWATRLEMAHYSEELRADYVKEGVITENMKQFALALKVRESFFKEGSVLPKLIGASRDIYEGGKPTFFYLVKLDDVSLIDYMRETREFQKNLPTDEDSLSKMDDAEYVMPVLWETLGMNQDTYDAKGRLKKKDARLTFYTPRHYKFDVEWRRVSYPCEKNLLAAFYFYDKYKINK